MSTLEQNTTELEALLLAVEALPEGGGDGLDTSDATATESDILAGKTAYVDGEKVTGTIATKTASDFMISGARVIVPAGYYASQVATTIASGSAKTPSTTITRNPTISVSSSGLITASVSGTESVTPTVSAGYVSSGTAGVIMVSGSATKQLTTQAAQTITPGTSDQTIASGVYITGTQTIKGDSNLVAGNIKSGVSIFGVSGSYEGSGSGGAAVETCSVYVEGLGEDGSVAYYSTLSDNGEITTVSTVLDNFWSNISCNLTNVVCGSTIALVLLDTDTTDSGISIDGTAEVLYHVPTTESEDVFILKAPTVSNESCSIYW